MYRQPRPIPILRPGIGAEDGTRGLLLAKLFYFCFFGAIGTLVPFLNVYFDRLGLSGAQIGWLGSVAPLVAVAANPIWGAVADRWQIHRQVLALCALGAGSVSLLLLVAEEFWTLMAIVVILTFFRTPIGALVDSGVMVLVRRAGLHYGRQRMWGSVGLVFAALTMGTFLDPENLRWTFLIHAILLGGVCALVGLRLPLRRQTRMITMADGLRQLTGQRTYMSFLGAMALLGIGTSSYINFLGLQALALGGDEFMLSVAWAGNALGEIPVMYLGGHYFARFRYSRLIQTGLFGYAVVWLLMASVRTPWALAASALMIGLCYGSLWVAAVSYAAEAAPPGLSATAQALVGMAQSGLGWGIGAVLAGYMWDAAGGTGVFSMAATAAVLASILFWVGNRGRHPVAVAG